MTFQNPIKIINSLEVADCSNKDPEDLQVGSDKEINDSLPGCIQSSDKRWIINLLQGANRSECSRNASGGFGNVYQALDTVLEKKVAIKIGHEGLSENARKVIGDTNRVKSDSNEELDQISTFLYEARVLARIRHPNVCEVYAFTTSKSNKDVDVPVIVMEWIDGERLSCIDKRYSLEQKLQQLEQIADAVDFVHKNKLLHRDIKPDSIMVTNEGIPKLIDFGLWKYAEHYTDAVMGTSSWMSPESIDGALPSKSDDIWGFSAVMVKYLLHHPPFDEGNSPDEAMANISMRNINRGLSFSNWFSDLENEFSNINGENIGKLFSKLFSTEINNRPKTAKEAYIIMKDWIDKVK